MSEDNDTLEIPDELLNSIAGGLAQADFDRITEVIRTLHDKGIKRNVVEKSWDLYLWSHDQADAGDWARIEEIINSVYGA